MSIDISLGIVVHYRDCQRVEWINFDHLEKDGSDPVFNPYAGFPARRCSIPGFLDWIATDATANAIYHRVKVKYPRNQTPEWTQVTDDLIELARELRTEGVSPAHADRARWLQYWLSRARETWGASAAIMFS